MQEGQSQSRNVRDCCLVDEGTVCRPTAPLVVLDKLYFGYCFSHWWNH